MPLSEQRSQKHPMSGVVGPNFRCLSLPMYVKPNMPILAGFFPVAKHCHAGTLSGGTIDSRIPWVPVSKIERMLGSLSIHFSIRYGEAESMPMTRAFISLLPVGVSSFPLEASLQRLL